MYRATTTVSQEPITPEDVKLQLRLDDEVPDAHLVRLIASARENVERLTGYALAKATYEWSPVGERREPLPLWPAHVTSPEGTYPISFETDPADAPPTLVTAMFLLIGDMLTNTEAVTEKPLVENPAFQRMILPFRRVLP